MADSTVTEISKMKVVDLRKELKSRGLSYSGDKSELVNRLQAAMSQEEQGDINLDSDEIDSDGVLEDEDDKSQTDILDDSAVDTLNEELALAEQPLPAKVSETKPTRILKRKLTTESSKTSDIKTSDTKEAGPKKIVLHRSALPNFTSAKTETEKTQDDSVKDIPIDGNKIKITADLDTKTKLELRAKRFGLPIKMSEAERKEARKQRFGNSTDKSQSISVNSSNSTLSENIEKLKKRADRFGQSVSKIMTDIENKEKLEKRKEKFQSVKI